MSDTINEVYALRYATRPGCLTSEAFYQYGLYGEADVAIGMDYFFWLIRSGGRTVLVDCGFGEGMGPKRDRWHDVAPAELLSRMGTDPADVDDVVLSHMHFDHVGNTHLFPSATFHIAHAEYDHWTGPHRDVPAFSWSVEADEVRVLEGLRRDERLRLIGDEGIVAPGVTARRFPGHTPGQLVTEVTAATGIVVLAADAMHYDAEVDDNRPFYLFTDLGQMLDSYRDLRALRAQPGVDLVAGHDPAVSSSYAEVEPGCLDLSRRIVDRAPVGGAS